MHLISQVPFQKFQHFSSILTHYDGSKWFLLGFPYLNQRWKQIYVSKCMFNWPTLFNHASTFIFILLLFRKYFTFLLLELFNLSAGSLFTICWSTLWGIRTLEDWTAKTEILHPAGVHITRLIVYFAVRSNSLVSSFPNLVTHLQSPSKIEILKLLDSPNL